MIAAIRTALVPAAPAEAASPPDLAAVRLLLTRLEGLLIASDGAALDCMLEAQDVLARTLSAEECAGLTQAVQNFEFGVALSRLHAITARLRPAAPGDTTGELGEVLKRLETLLAKGDGEALEAALGAQEPLARAFGAEQAKVLLRAVSEFDFDTAQIRVRGLAARLGAAPTRE